MTNDIVKAQVIDLMSHEIMIPPVPMSCVLKQKDTSRVSKKVLL